MLSNFRMKTTYEAFQALWIEISFVSKKNVVVAFFTDSTIHLNVFNNILIKP